MSVGNAPQECPRCRLLNEPGTSTCDCGYDFATGKKGPPRQVSRGDTPPPTAAEFAVIEAGALAYRRLIALVGMNAVVGGAGYVALRLIDDGVAPVVGLVRFVLVILLGALSAQAAYRVAGAVDARPEALYAFSAILPVVSIITLLALSSRATEWARRNNLEVGLMGPGLESLEVVRRRVGR